MTTSVAITCPNAGPSYLGEKLREQELRVCSNCQFLTDTMSWQTRELFPFISCLWWRVILIFWEARWRSQGSVVGELHPKPAARQGTICSYQHKSIGISGTWMPSSDWSLSTWVNVLWSCLSWSTLRWILSAFYGSLIFEPQIWQLQYGPVSHTAMLLFSFRAVPSHV